MIPFETRFNGIHTPIIAPRTDRLHERVKIHPILYDFVKGRGLSQIRPGHWVIGYGLRLVRTGPGSS